MPMPCAPRPVPLTELLQSYKIYISSQLLWFIIAELTEGSCPEHWNTPDGVAASRCQYSVEWCLYPSLVGTVCGTPSLACVTRNNLLDGACWSTKSAHAALPVRGWPKVYVVTGISEPTKDRVASAASEAPSECPVTVTA